MSSAKALRLSKDIFISRWVLSLTQDPSLNWRILAKLHFLGKRQYLLKSIHRYSIFRYYSNFYIRALSNKDLCIGGICFSDFWGNLFKLCSKDMWRGCCSLLYRKLWRYLLKKFLVYFCAFKLTFNHYLNSEVTLVF